MIDLDALRVSRRLSWTKARQNLALLEPLLLAPQQPDRPPPVPRSLPRESRASRPPDPRGFARRIEEATRAWAERLWRRWGRRCRLDQQVLPGLQGAATAWSVAVATSTRRRSRALLADPDAPFRRPGTPSSSRTRGRPPSPRPTMNVGGRPRAGDLQAIQPQEVARPAPHLVPALARLAVVAGRPAPDQPGIPTPRNLAFLARRGNAWYNPFSWFLPHETYLVTRQAGARHHPGRVRPQGRCPRSTRRGAGDRVRTLNLGLARLIRSLHERSLSHRDLKASNILVAPRRLESDELPQPHRPGRASGSRIPSRAGRRIQNLARLSLSLRRPGPHADRDPAVPPGLPPLGALPTLRLEGRLAIAPSRPSWRSRSGTGAGADPFPDPEAMGARA